MSGRIPGFTSTGSKRPEALFGAGSDASLPTRMVRSHGCRVWDQSGREFTDYIMGLGAVALGYGHEAVTGAAQAAVRDGVIGPLPPVLEEELAQTISRLMPWVEAMRFLKTGAEALAAAVRLARTHTGRDLVIGCGYHGWLDWCQPAGSAGVPNDKRIIEKSNYCEAKAGEILRLYPGICIFKNLCLCFNVRYDQNTI
jgi:glutamate-1-semialdehyde 2,1-aminomutase